MFPVLYEINTRCWLAELTAQSGHPVSLGNVPDQQFNLWQKLGFTHIWLMGAWTTGPLARGEALSHPSLRQSYSEVLPGWTEVDVSGSPYAIADYTIAPLLGGEEGLKSFREKLHGYGLKLVLDFVPNHVGVDHPWVGRRPELFVQSPMQTPETFAQETSSGKVWLAHGKDPYFAAWTDTAQLDYRRAETQAAMIELLHSLAKRCDGVRCDMAMLVLSDVFARTWERFPLANQPPQAEFWQTAIRAIKSAQTGFLFLAEAYWGLEGHLLGLGFDYTYDKTLYDGLSARDAGGVYHHLVECRPELIEEGAHFLENHDEPRIASLLSPAEHAAAALVVLGLPGMRFLHEGQLSGAKRRVPVQLRRRLSEPPQPEIAAIYDRLLTTLPRTAVGSGKWELLRPSAAWPENPTAQNLVVVQWEANAPEFDLVVVNLAPHPSQCYVSLTVPGLESHEWLMKDLLGDALYERPGKTLKSRGLYLDLPAHGAQLFHLRPKP
jgi:hypothetical protein